jgi:hypothetical protein
MRSGTMSGSGRGAVRVNERGAFTMYGGTISGNRNDDGGGVYVGYGGTFTMYGGTIRDNTAGRGGGVYVGSSATFTKTGGVIYGDTDTAHTAGNTENTAAQGASGWGHAVFWFTDYGWRNTNGNITPIHGARYRDATLTEGDNLSTGAIPTMYNEALKVGAAANWSAHRDLK